jgi:ABC-type polysaccharide/polyol phosphate export permease
MFGITTTQLQLALADIFGGMAEWRLWHFLAWQEIKQRYRRSFLGPWWVSLSTLLQICTIGFVTSYLFRQPLHEHLPYLAVSIILWTLISGIITEGTSTYISAASYILQIKRPSSVYIYQMIWRNFIMTGHNMAIYVLFAVIYTVVPGWTILFLIPALPLAIASIGWIAVLLGTLSTRFRDVPVLLSSLMGILFWITPVLYRPEMLGEKRYLADLNPFTHVLQILRAPLLGELPRLSDWLAVGGVTVVGWTIALLFFARFRARIPYWL